MKSCKFAVVSISATFRGRTAAQTVFFEQNVIYDFKLYEMSHLCSELGNEAHVWITRKTLAILPQSLNKHPGQ